MTISFHVSPIQHLLIPATNVDQQTNLALNISETVINLHRPYYAKALYDDVDDPVKSKYAPSFLAVVERCSVESPATSSTKSN